MQKHEYRHTQSCSPSACLHPGHACARSHTTSHCDRRLLRRRCHRSEPERGEACRVHVSKHLRNTRRARACLCYSARSANTVICSYRFINICRRASTNTQTLLPPPLIFFPSTRFQSPFCFLCHCSSLPPSLPPLAPTQVPQLEVKSLAIPPPWFWPPLPSVFPSKLSATPFSASCLPLSPPSLCVFSPRLFTRASACDVDLPVLMLASVGFRMTPISTTWVSRHKTVVTDKAASLNFLVKTNGCIKCKMLEETCGGNQLRTQKDQNTASQSHRMKSRSHIKHLEHTLHFSAPWGRHKFMLPNTL